MKVKIKGVKIKLSLKKDRHGSVDLWASDGETAQVIAWLRLKTGKWARTNFVSPSLPFVRESKTDGSVKF